MTIDKVFAIMFQVSIIFRSTREKGILKGNPALQLSVSPGKNFIFVH